MSKTILCFGDESYDLKPIGNTQTEQIVWHKYPEEKPIVRKPIMISALSVVYDAVYTGERFEIKGYFPIWDVKAWAYPLKGWKE